jgi:hypothetical protein
VIAAVFVAVGVLTAIFALFGITPRELHRTLPF